MYIFTSNRDFEVYTDEVKKNKRIVDLLVSAGIACEGKGSPLEDTEFTLLNVKVFIRTSLDFKHLLHLNKKLIKSKKRFILAYSFGKRMFFIPLKGKVNPCFNCYFQRLKIAEIRRKHLRKFYEIIDCKANRINDLSCIDKNALPFILKCIKDFLRLYPFKSSENQSKVLEINLDTKQVSFHRLSRYPLCDVCITKSRNRQITLKTNFSLNKNSTLKKISDLIDSDIGIIKSLLRRESEDGVIDYSAISGNPLDGNSQINAGAVDTDKKIAKIRGSVEALERYSALIHQNIVTGDKVRGAIDPKSLILFSDDQYKISGFPYIPVSDKKKIDWIRGFSLKTGKEIFIPAAATYLYYNESSGKKFFPSHSHGLAASTRFEHAIINGMVELVERDSAMITWNRKLEAPLLNPKFKNKDLEALHSKCIDDNLEVFFAITTLDIKIPTVMTILINKGHGFPYISCGLGSNFDIEKSTLKSLKEAIMVRHTLKILNQHTELNIPKKPDEVKSLLDHTLFYAKKNNSRAFKFLVKGNYIDFEETKPDTSNYKTYLKELIKNGLDPIFCDITPIDIREKGFCAVRVVIPGIQLMDREHIYRYKGGKRLYSVPQKLGVDSGKFNEWPHPLG